MEVNVISGIFIFVIVVIAAGSFLWFFLQYQSLKRLCNRLVVQIKRYGDRIEPEQLGELESFFKGTKLSDIWDEFAGSLVKKEYDEAVEGHRTYVHKTLNTSEYFSEARIMNQFLMVRYLISVPALLVGLGILGTFFGLTQGLADFDFETSKKIKESIELLLSGLKTAFYTSIAGMICSILFNVLEKVLFKDLGKHILALQVSLDRLFTLTSQQQIAIETFDSIDQQTQALKSFSTDLADSIKLSMREVMAGRLDDMGKQSLKGTQEIINQINAVADSVGNKLQEVMSREITPALNNVKDAVETLNVEKQESSVDAIRQLVESFHESLSGTTQTQLDNLNDVVSHITQSLVTLPDQFTQIMAEMREEMGNMHQRMQQATKISREEIERQRGEVQKSYEGIMNTLQQVIADQKEGLSQATKEAHQEMLQLTGQIGKIVGSITSSVENSIQDQLDLVKQTAMDTANESAAATDLMRQQVEETTDRFKGSLEEVQGGISHLLQQQESQADFVNDLIESSRDILTQGQELAKQMEASATEIIKIHTNMESLSVKMLTATDSLNQTSDHLSQATSDFTEQNQKHVAASQETLRNMQNSMRESQTVMSNFSDKFEIIDGGLTNIFGQIQEGLNEYAITTRESVNKYLGDFSTQLRDASSALAGSVEALSETVTMLDKMKHRKVARLLDRTVVYEHNNRYRWNGCGAIAASESALVMSWYTGGVKEPTEENLVVWSRSLDRGKAWSEPVEISNPPGMVRATDPMLWRGSDGVVHYAYATNDMSLSLESAVYRFVRRTCSNPAADQLEWSDEIPIEPQGDTGYTEVFFNNKPIQLDNGEWLIPVALRTQPIPGKGPHHWGFAAAGAMISSDDMKTWEVFRGKDFEQSSYGSKDMTVWEPWCLSAC